MRNYAGKSKGICSYNLVHNFLIQLSLYQKSYKVQFLWCTFEPHFGVETMHVQKAVLRMKLFFSFNLSLSIQLIQGCEKLFSLISSSKSKFFTRFALVSLLSHSCWTRVVRVALVSLLSHSCRTSVARVWHSFCKMDQILNLSLSIFL